MHNRVRFLKISGQGAVLCAEPIINEHTTEARPLLNRGRTF